MTPASGTVTFLFTDIEGSTKLAQTNSESYNDSLEKHHDLMDKIICANNGFVFKLIGDAFCASFENAEDAVRAAVSAQTELNTVDWGESVIKVRMGIHTGNAEWNEKDYMGYMTLARTNRVMSLAYGGQILISHDSVDHIGEALLQPINFRDFGERRLKDLIQPMRLYQIISPVIPSEFPPLKTLDARPNNLPVQLTSFIGRDRELSELKNLCLGTRLLTLLGPGGTGKTRLALQAGADLIDEFANGVWIAELASINDKPGLLQAIMKALNIEEHGQRTMEESIALFLKDKELILILDNCEHVINECAALAEYLLGQTDKLRIIATSRESLKCSGEQSYIIPSLAHPDRTEKLSPESLMQYESVRLFVERTLLVNPKFRVSNENASALSEVCSRLDGIPLAIELAAAKMKVMSVEKLNSRLDDRFRLLTSGKRTALPRQQTLKALIDWSYDLLPDEEKILWKRLSVFSGGFSLEAAEEVCSDDDLDEFGILDSINNLAEKSILIFDDSAERYKMLETIHQYGSELLIVDKAELDALRMKHLKYFETFSRQQNVLFRTPEQAGAFDRIEADHGNIQSALSYSFESGDYVTTAEIASLVSYVWIIRGYLFIGNSWFDKLLAHENEIPKKTFSGLLDRAGGLKLHLSAYDECERLYEKSLLIKEELGDKEGIMLSLNRLGPIKARKGEYQKAGLMFEQFLSMVRELDMKSSLPNALNNLILLELYTGAYEMAHLHIEESLQVCQECGNLQELYFANRNAAKLAFALGDIERSIEFHNKALLLSREISYKSGISVTLTEMAQALILKNDPASAKLKLEESLMLAKESDEKICIAMSLIGLGELSEAESDDTSAANYFGEALKLYRMVGDLSGLVIALKNYARVKLRSDEINEAKSILIECLRLNLKMGQKQEAPEVMFILSEVLLREKKINEAFQLLKIAGVAASELDEKAAARLIENIDNRVSEMCKEYPGEYESSKASNIGSDTIESIERIVNSIL